MVDASVAGNYNDDAKVVDANAAVPTECSACHAKGRAALHLVGALMVVVAMKAAAMAAAPNCCRTSCDVIMMVGATAASRATSNAKVVGAMAAGHANGNAKVGAAVKITSAVALERCRRSCRVAMAIGATAVGHVEINAKVIGAVATSHAKDDAKVGDVVQAAGEAEGGAKVEGTAATGRAKGDVKVGDATMWATSHNEGAIIMLGDVVQSANDTMSTAMVSRRPPQSWQECKISMREDAGSSFGLRPRACMCAALADNARLDEGLGSCARVGAARVDNPWPDGVHAVLVVNA